MIFKISTFKAIWSREKRKQTNHPPSPWKKCQKLTLDEERIFIRRQLFFDWRLKNEIEKTEKKKQCATDRRNIEERFYDKKTPRNILSKHSIMSNQFVHIYLSYFWPLPYLSGIEVALERFIHSDLLSSYTHDIYNYLIFINNNKVCFILYYARLLLLSIKTLFNSCLEPISVDF